MSVAEFTIAPERASNLAGPYDLLFVTLLIVTGLVTLAIAGAILFFAIRYRHGARSVRTPHHGTSVGLEITWTAITLLVFLGIFIWAAVLYYRMSQPPKDALEVHVVAKQWMWYVQHANGRREINEMHLLVGQPVKLVMISQDVIHSFFVPAFRIKQDVLPDRYTVVWFTPTKPGRYHLFCAEYCGLDHSRMTGWIQVLEANAYAQWLGQAGQSDSLVAAGARLFQGVGCSGCHAANAAVRAPLLGGLFGKPVALADGTIVIADDQYLHDSIVLPQKQVVAGFVPVMPSFQGVLTEQQISELIAYIKANGASQP